MIRNENKTGISDAGYRTSDLARKEHSLGFGHQRKQEDAAETAHEKPGSTIPVSLVKSTGDISDEERPQLQGQSQAGITDPGYKDNKAYICWTLRMGSRNKRVRSSWA